MPARLKIRLTEPEEEELSKLSHNPNIPERTRKRAEVVRLNALGWNVNQIASWMDCAPNTVRRTIQRWIFQGYEGLEDIRRSGRKRTWKQEDIEYLISKIVVIVNPELITASNYLQFLRMNVK